MPNGTYERTIKIFAMPSLIQVTDPIFGSVVRLAMFINDNDDLVFILFVKSVLMD